MDRHSTGSAEPTPIESHDARPARERLVSAAQTLFWARGVDGTTPRDILRESGVGQGSLYHHFPTKHALAVEVLTHTTEQTLTSARATLTGEGLAVDRLANYLARHRDARAGCKIGRLTSDPVVMEDEELHEPLATYFTGLLDLVTLVLWEQGLPEPKARDRAFTIVAVIQGGYVLARALGDDSALDRALTGLRTLCDIPEPEKTGSDRVAGLFEGER